MDKLSDYDTFIKSIEQLSPNEIEKYDPNITIYKKLEKCKRDTNEWKKNKFWKGSKT